MTQNVHVKEKRERPELSEQGLDSVEKSCISQVIDTQMVRMSLREHCRDKVRPWRSKEYYHKSHIFEGKSKVATTYGGWYEQKADNQTTWSANGPAGGGGQLCTGSVGLPRCRLRALCWLFGWT